MGLLPPAYVDEQTGYRYYLETQLEKAKLIGLLRQLEMPLNQIAQVLDLETKAAIHAIAGYWNEVEKDIASKRKLVHYLETYLEAKGEHMYEIFEREVGEQKVLTIKKPVYVKDLPTFITESMNRLMAYLDKSNLKPSGLPFVIYHGQVNNDSDGPVESCVPFVGNLEPRTDMQIRLEPAHKEAYTRLSKGEIEFPGLLQAYDAVAKHLKTKGISECGSPREVYFADWSSAKDTDLVCDIAFPY
jgi:DNA-binding transcriptional MerR regulator